MFEDIDTSRKIKAVMATYAALPAYSNKPLSDDALIIYAEDLAPYSVEQVDAALKRLRRETSFFSPHEIISRIDDGRPLPEEAWGMIPKNEVDSCVWSEEMAAAYAAAEPMINAGDMIAARVAFIEYYKNKVLKVRAEGTPAKWSPSFGSDHSGRERALRDAVGAKRIGRNAAARLLPASTFTTNRETVNALIDSALPVDQKTALPAPEDVEYVDRPRMQDRLKDIFESIEPKNNYEDAEPFKHPTAAEIAHYAKALGA